MASTASSQSNSNLGILSQASKLVSSVFGGGKKAKPEVKSLQLAAAAAKKVGFPIFPGTARADIVLAIQQQEEQEKKAQRLKEMEVRRQQALQRKADEEKARHLEEERKIKEEAERRKREREEQTDKRPPSRTANAPKKVRTRVHAVLRIEVNRYTERGRHDQTQAWSSDVAEATVQGQEGPRGSQECQAQYWCFLEAHAQVRTQAAYRRHVCPCHAWYIQGAWTQDRQARAFLQ